MKLYAKNDKYKSSMSMEQYVKAYKQTAVVSTESMEHFFASVKDTLTAVSDNVFSTSQPYVLEAMRNKRSAIVRSREVKFQHFSEETISKQECFSGYYSDYLKDLRGTIEVVDAQTNKILNTLAMTVGTFINEYDDNKLDVIYGQPVFSSAVKDLPSIKKKISVYFKAPSGKFKTLVGDVLKNMGEIEGLYAETEAISKELTDEKILTIKKKTESLSELIDTLISVNATSGVLNKSSTYKQNLIDAIHVAAEYVEYHHALLANWVFYTKAFKELTTALVDFPTQ